MWYGIESGNETMLQNMNKEYTLDNVRKTIKIAKEAGIKTICSFIVGFPGETAETLKDSLRFINEIKPDTTVMIPFVLQRGSPVAYFPQYYGVELHEDWIDKVLKPWNEREQHQIDYYTISGMPNTIWLEQFKDQSGYKDRIDKSESTDYEIAELLSALLGIPRKDFVQKINDAINKKDLSTLRYFISMAWEISKQHIEG